jgi:hypothetical protein
VFISRQGSASFWLAQTNGATETHALSQGAPEIASSAFQAVATFHQNSHLMDPTLVRLCRYAAFRQQQKVSSELPMIRMRPVDCLVIGWSGKSRHRLIQFGRECAERRARNKLFSQISI